MNEACHFYQRVEDPAIAKPEDSEGDNSIIRKAFQPR